jgi:uncharacterized membrane protein
MFSLFKRKDFFTAEEKLQIVEAIRVNEKRTSGEIRVFVERKCKYVNPLDRAAQVFYGLKMDNTEDHNAVLVYIATKHHQLSVFGDAGIYQKTGQPFWNEKVSHMIQNFNRNDYTKGLVQVINEIGEALYVHFPYNNDTDKNELPDDIVFGN